MSDDVKCYFKYEETEEVLKLLDTMNYVAEMLRTPIPRVLNMDIGFDSRHPVNALNWVCNKNKTWYPSDIVAATASWYADNDYIFNMLAPDEPEEKTWFGGKVIKEKVSRINTRFLYYFYIQLLKQFIQYEDATPVNKDLKDSIEKRIKSSIDVFDKVKYIVLPCRDIYIELFKKYFTVYKKTEKSVKLDEELEKDKDGNLQETKLLTNEEILDRIENDNYTIKNALDMVKENTWEKLLNIKIPKKDIDEYKNFKDNYNKVNNQTGGKKRKTKRKKSKNPKKQRKSKKKNNKKSKKQRKL